MAGDEMNSEECRNRREQVSALADGQLDGLEFVAAVKLAAEDDDARASWHVYHLVGEVLRSSEPVNCGHDRDFVARLGARLRAEPANQQVMESGLNDANKVARNDRLALEVDQISQKIRHAANDASFRWKLVAAFASLAAMGVIGLNAIQALDDSPAGARLAQSSAVPAGLIAASQGPVTGASLAAADPMVMIRDPRLDELLAAHRQFGGTSAFQNPSGFLRNATFEGSAR
jgi:sigma-E factor negative regulatory protein RseA